MIAFHRLLISTAIVFCVGLTAWSASQWRQSGETSTLAMALACAGAAAALVYYLRHLQRFLGR